MRELIANWWITPKFVANDLEYKGKLKHGMSWEVIKQFPWGELAYDYDEGLKFGLNINVADIKKMIAFVKDFYRKHNINSVAIFEDQHGLELTVCNKDSYEKARSIILSTGFRQGEDEFIYYLPN